jgi:hypothetical protein
MYQKNWNHATKFKKFLVKQSNWNLKVYYISRQRNTKNVFGFRKEFSTQVKKPKPIGAFNEKVSTNVDVELTFHKQKECP